MNTDKRALPLEELDELLLEDGEKSPSNRPMFLGPVIRWFRSLNWLFIFCVVVPTLTAAIYFGFFASDVYVSYSSFVVQSAKEEEGMGSGLSSILPSSMSSSSDQDTASVEEYMKSRDALRQLEKDAGIREAFSNSKIDTFSRFGGLFWWDTSFESFYRYYADRLFGKSVVSVNESENSDSILEVEVRAFSPEEANLINKRLLEMGESLVNDLNDRLQKDMVHFAQEEVDDEEKKAEAAYVALANYRNANTLVDPEQQSTIQLGLIGTLQQKLLDTQNQLSEVTRSSANNPQIPALQNQISSLQAQMNSEMAKAAGKSNSLSSKASEYERLTVVRDFCEKQLSEALSFLEKSRDDAQRQQLYLKRVVEPNSPDVPTEPKGVILTLSIMVLGFVIWGILTLFVAGVREHVQ